MAIHYLEEPRLSRDYGLDGNDTRRAIEAGYDNADWYRAPIDPDRLQSLMVRRNLRPGLDAALWLALIAGFGVIAFMTLGSWWAIPAFAAFGTLWGGTGDSRWHENGHSTVFRTRWANEAVYNIASFMMLREPTMWRWQHVRHHSSTSIVGLDPEITIKRPPSFAMIAANYLNLVNGPTMIVKIVGHAFGHCDEYTRIVVPADKFRRVVWEARVFLLLLIGALVAAIELGTIVPLLFVGLPTFYGAWFMWFCAITQHAGLREDVLDHRMSTRTVYINPVFRFMYLNMNYHLEHHMFPAVPYYNLPALHEEIKAYLPPPKTSMFDAYREIFRTLREQRRDPSYELNRDWTPPFEMIEARNRAIVEVALSDAGTTDLGPSGLLERGDLTELVIDGRPFLLCRMLDGAYAFADGMCTHGRANLADGFLDDCFIECPKHNGRFDLRTGEAVRYPAREPLRIYPIRELGGRLITEVPPIVEPAGLSQEEDSIAPAQSAHGE